MNCIFCKIIAREIPAYTIYEDETVLAFLDISPDTDGHTLIIPKKHYLDLGEIDNDTLIHIMSVARDISKLLEEKLNSKGTVLVQNNGIVQEVKHYHLHIKPVYDKDKYHEKNKVSDVKEVFDRIMK